VDNSNSLRFGKTIPSLYFCHPLRGKRYLSYSFAHQNRGKKNLYFFSKKFGIVGYKVRYLHTLSEKRREGLEKKWGVERKERERFRPLRSGNSGRERG